VNLLLNANLSPTLVQDLTKAGYQATHVIDHGLQPTTGLPLNRLGPYLATSAGDLNQALRLYSWTLDLPTPFS